MKTASSQETVGKLFIAHLKNNITRYLASFGDILLVLSISGPSKLPSVNSEDLYSYGETAIRTLFEHYGTETSAGSLDGETKVKEPVISSDVVRVENFPSVHG